MDPVTLSAIIGLGTSAIQGVAGLIGKNKAKKEHDAAYKDLMGQNFGATAAAKKYYNEPVSADLMRRMFDETKRTTGSGIMALDKGGSRTASQVGNIMDVQNRQNLSIGQMEQSAYQDASHLMAGQEFAGQQMKLGLQGQNVAGMAQREMEQQGNMNAGFGSLAQNAVAFGLYGDKTIDPTQIPPTQQSVNGTGEFNTDISQNAYGRGILGGGFNSFLNFGMPNFLTQNINPYK